MRGTHRLLESRDRAHKPSGERAAAAGLSIEPKTLKTQQVLPKRRLAERAAPDHAVTRQIAERRTLPVG
jgi:hypothetical protein